MKKLKLGIPKGSLQEATVALFKKAGFSIRVSSRSYIPTVDDPELEIVMLRAQEMSRYVEEGVLDAGLTGNDWILENASKVKYVSELIYAKTTRNPVRWVLAVPEKSKIKKITDLNGKRIATELVNATKTFLASHKVKADIEFSWGATEVKVASGLVDAIVDLTETGSSLRANNLRIVDTICTSTTQFIANKKAYKDNWKKKKIESINLLLHSAINAEGKVGLKMNVKEKDLDTILKVLPSLNSPTISLLSKEGWFDVDTIVDENIVRTLIPALKQAKAEGIIEYPLSKIIY